MAVPSNKSCSSPVSGRARNSEIMGNPMRRSFSGNPFNKPSIVPNPRGLNPNTPANSPSEHMRRSSMGRESIVTLRDNEDNKENGKLSRVRSPVSSKGTKNFMSPTISAASKINASPRKKILEERNEPVRASVSFSDFKIPSLSQTSVDSEHMKESLASPLIPKDLKTEAVFDSKNESDSASKANSVCEEPVCEIVIEEPELVNLDPSFKISPPRPPPCSSSIPIIAPLDSDPLAPPYDPKTNYLSPRPRFLHYKPNPRVELYLSQTREGKRLEESFISGTSLFDADATEEEEGEETQSESSLKGSEEDNSSGEEVKAEEKQEEKEHQEEEELLVSEPSPIDELTSEESGEARSVPKTRSVWRPKLTALLIVLSLACLSISLTTSPIIDHSVFDDSFLKQYDHSEIFAFAKESFDEVAQKFGVWYSNSVSFFYELIPNLRGAHKLGPFKYYNLTALLQDVRVDVNEGTLGKLETNMFVSSKEKEVHIEHLEEMDQLDIGAAESNIEAPEMHMDAEYMEQVEFEAETSVEYINSDSNDVQHQAPIVEVVEPEILAGEQNQEEENNVPGPEVTETGEFQEKIGVQHQAPIVEMVEPKILAGEQNREEENNVPGPEVTEAGEFQEKVDVTSGAEWDAKADEVQPEVPEVGASVHTGSGPETKPATEEFRAKSPELDFSERNVIGISLLVALALIASTAFISMKKWNNNNSTLSVATANSICQGLVAKKLDSNLIPPVSPENTFDVRPSSWNYSGDSCPSEMSSFQNTSSYIKKGLNENNEAQSYERKPRKNQRRESMASSSMDSSMGSPSYGSFTTYEKIPTKNVYGDEEIITPVRRSSRLKNHVTSP